MKRKKIQLRTRFLLYSLPLVVLQTLGSPSSLTDTARASAVSQRQEQNATLEPLETALYSEARYKCNFLPKKEDITFAPQDTLVGMIQRTLRWERLIDETERRYGLPAGYLAGIVMQESYGEPLQTNSTNDGGIGLAHMQCPTARELGLRTYGDCRGFSDKKHGLQLLELLRKCDYDPACVADGDERADPEKNLDAAARYIMEGKRKHQSWDRAVQYFRGPRFVGTKTGKKYLERVLQYRKAYLREDLREKAREDFESRNSGMVFTDYLLSYASENNFFYSYKKCGGRDFQTN